MREFHIFSPEKDHKIAFWCSVVFMALAWLVLAGLFIVIPVWGGLKYGFSFSSVEWYGYCIWGVYLFVVVMIPVQLARYFRKKRP